MRILIIRHADPDYSIDGLTEKGKIEAELLKNKLVNESLDHIYCSILGRARCTIAPTLEAKGLSAEYCDWLREFDYAKIKVPYQENAKIMWDILPQFVDETPLLYDPEKWTEVDFIKNSEGKTAYNNVCTEFDKVLKAHGYERTKFNYKVNAPSHETLVFVCHYGLECVLLSHIMNCSPYSLWQNCFAPPSSVTTIYTEERRDGFASLRINGIGDISHLYAGAEPPAFAGRFCECFTDDTRHN